jgi:hypothetical protein
VILLPQFMAKPKVTRTYGPIHFEDLDPKRFEDLVRELIYDFKDWQTIEATGRSGNDGGFDVRAYEKIDPSLKTENEEEEIDETHPMDGKLWMIQGKREKEIGPKRVEEILSEVDKKNPPYGYVLAASSNFSKDSYDVFRRELRKKGVMEFYMWGKAELEDMLHLPKNDRILFTFFGISLVSRRRSRTTEVKSLVAIKNKLFKALGGDKETTHEHVLIRDLKDTKYPFEDEYKDFEKNPRWREYVAFRYHPIGLWVHSRRFYAYVNRDKKEFDFTRVVDLLPIRVEDEDERKAAFEEGDRVREIWEFLPRSQQGYFMIDGLLGFEDISVIDAEGDGYYNFPHIYVDIKEDNPFIAINNVFEVGEKKIRRTDEWKQVDFFPKEFPKHPKGKKKVKKELVLDPESLQSFKEHSDRIFALYDIDDRYSSITVRDIFSIKDSATDYSQKFIQITSKFKIKIKDYLAHSPDNYHWANKSIKAQIGRDFTEDEEINVCEFKTLYKHDIEGR